MKHIHHMSLQFKRLKRMYAVRTYFLKVSIFFRRKQKFIGFFLKSCIKLNKTNYG